MPSISVIVPVYQAEKFLRDCVESVRRQTFSDWELLLVDDGCTDGSPALCDELAREDDRIRVFHKERNSGVSETRNVGLDHVRGTYIAFLDSDDQYEPQCLETLWNLRERAGADTAACAHLNLWPDGSETPEPDAARRDLRRRRYPGENRQSPAGGPAGPAGVQWIHLALSVLRRDF